MPQFDTAFFSSQIFWTIASFLVLFVVLSRWILPRIVSILQQRTQFIEAEISAAQKKHEEADELKNEYTTKLSGIEKETQQLFDASERRIIERRRQLMDEWKEELEKKKRSFREDTEVMRQQAIRDVRAQSADLIVAATEQLIHQKVHGEGAQKILDEAIDDMEKNRIQ